MENVLKKMYQNTVTALQLVYKSTTGIDHKLLNHYILKINQLHDIDSIIYQASRCLSYILDYRFFAFAMYDKQYNGGIDIWMDPKTENLAILNHIKNDFLPRNLDCNIRYFESTLENNQREISHIDLTNIIPFKVMDSQTTAILYLYPRRPLLNYHHELIGIIVKSLATAIANFLNFKKLQNAALVDPLTHCYNRRALDRYIAHDVACAERYGSSLGIIMFDLDHFKKINDIHGHRAGDAVLRAVSKCVLAAIRKSDYLARIGGEEFLLVLPGTKFSKAIELAERLRSIIENLKIKVDDKIITATASFGVTFYKKGSSKDNVLKKADEMLYEAKRQGRNRIKPDLRLYHTVAHENHNEKPLLH